MDPISLTGTELYDVVEAALSDEWRDEDAIYDCIVQFEILYRGAHTDGVEFESIDDPRETFREYLHLLRTGGAKLANEDETGDVLFVPESGEPVNLSRIRMRRGRSALIV